MFVAVLTTGDPQVAELRVQGEEVEHHRAGQRQRHPGKEKNKNSFLQPKKDKMNISNSFQQEQKQEHSTLLDLASFPPTGKQGWGSVKNRLMWGISSGESVLMFSCLYKRKSNKRRGRNYERGRVFPFVFSSPTDRPPIVLHIISFGPHPPILLPQISWKLQTSDSPCPT